MNDRHNLTNEFPNQLEVIDGEFYGVYSTLGFALGREPTDEEMLKFYSEMERYARCYAKTLKLISEA